MKIIKKLFLSFVIAGLGFATLVGCVSLENAERISIVEMPTTTFVKNCLLYTSFAIEVRIYVNHEEYPLDQKCLERTICVE